MGYCCQNHPFPSLVLFSHWHALYYLVVVVTEVVFFPTELCGTGQHSMHWADRRGEWERGRRAPLGFRKPSLSRTTDQGGMPSRLGIWEGEYLSRSPTHSKFYSLFISVPRATAHGSLPYPAFFPRLSATPAHSCRGQRAEMVESTKPNILLFW